MKYINIPHAAPKTVAAPPLRTELIEKLTNNEGSKMQQEGALLSSYRLLAMLVHQNTTDLHLPGCNRKRRLSIRDSTELENLAEDIAMGAPAVMRLCFGKNLPYPLRTKLLATDRFFHQWNRMRNLQCLEAFTISCNSTHLELIASNLPELRYVCN